MLDDAAVRQEGGHPWSLHGAIKPIVARLCRRRGDYVLKGFAVAFPFRTRREFGLADMFL